MSRLILRIVVLFAAIAAWDGAYAAPSLPTLASTESAVTIKVTPKNLQGPTWEFDITFDTHTQALNDDLAKSAVLVLADGTQMRPLSWKADPSGGHHRKGTLQFKAPAPAPTSLELRISRAGEAAPRTFKWMLK